MQIRAYIPQDYPQVKEILEEAKMFDATWNSETNLASMVEADPESVQVAVVDSRVVGNIILDAHGNETVFFYRFAVKESYRKQGIGAALFAKAEEVAKSKGYKEIAFYVDGSNQKLQQYYAQKGYDTSEKQYVCMWKTLK